MGFGDAGGGKFAVDAGGGVEEGFELIEGFLGGFEGFFFATGLAVGEVFGEGLAGAADAESPALEGGVLVGEAGEVFPRFHSRWGAWEGGGRG